eukprot:UN00253
MLILTVSGASSTRKTLICAFGNTFKMHCWAAPVYSCAPPPANCQSRQKVTSNTFTFDLLHNCDWNGCCTGCN